MKQLKLTLRPGDNMAGRIRSIKPEFLDDEKLGAMCPFDRLMFACSWLLADDYGNFRANPKWIKAQAFCYDENTSVEDIAESVIRLDSAGMFIAYNVRGQHYLHVTNWQHQRIDKPGKPRCPGVNESEITEEKTDVGVIPDCLDNSQEKILDTTGSPAPDLDQEGNRKWKGKRGNDSRESYPSVVDCYFSEFESARGSKPVFGAKEGKAVKSLIESAGGDPVRACEFIKNAFATDWWRDKATILKIANDPSQFASKPKPGKQSAFAPRVQKNDENNRIQPHRYVPPEEDYDNE
jgi:hypothetical protein